MAQSKDKRTTVSGTVSPELGEWLEDYRWTNRKNRSVVIGEALEEWAKSKGFEPSATGEQPADDSADTDTDTADENGESAEPVGAAPAKSRRAR